MANMLAALADVTSGLTVSSILVLVIYRPTEAGDGSPTARRR
jgi:hypothetical protein